MYKYTGIYIFFTLSLKGLTKQNKTQTLIFCKCGKVFMLFYVMSITDYTNAKE